MIFARSGSGANVTTLLERASRFLILLPNPDRRPARRREPHRLGAGAAVGRAAADGDV